MARGDVKWFAAFDKVSKDGVAFTLSTNALKMGIVTSATVPGVGTNDPRWGAGGTTNFSTNQVATGTAYTGPIALTTVTWARAAGVVTLDFDNVVVAQDAGGFTDGAYAIVYNDTVSGKYAMLSIDLGGPVSLVTGALTITVNASGIGTDTAT